jgi:hypothetical protein
VFFLLFWPANLLNSVLVGFVSSPSVSTLCVRRCSLLEMLLLSGKKVHWDPIYSIDSCPVPARHGASWLYRPAMVFPEMTHRSALKARAGQPAHASSSAARPRTEAPKSPKWSPHHPLAQSAASDLKSEAEVRFL